MTKEEALQSFFGSYGITAYPNTAVPDRAQLPYISYEVQTGDYWSGAISLTAQLWWYTSDENKPNAKVREISAAIGTGKYVRCDDGAILFTKGAPFSVSVNGQDDNNMKVRQLNIDAEFITST